MLNRREYLKRTALVAATAALPSGLLRAIEQGEPIMRAVPRTGERLPVVGLGTSATFRGMAAEGETDPLREVIRGLIDNGGRVLDTAPAYDNAEEVCGQLARDLGLTDEIFWGTKLNVVPRDSSASADPAAAREQLDRSLARIGKKPIDLIQVHDVSDIPGHMPVLQEFREDGHVRYIGVTSTRKYQYETLERAMRDYPLDFIGVDYAVDNRSAAERILPLARDRGIAVLVYVPFGRTRLWQRVSGIDVPDWAREFGADTWGRFFIKFAAAHPTVTCVTPATSRFRHLVDNMGAMYGDLPDETMQQRMAEFIDSLPEA